MPATPTYLRAGLELITLISKSVSLYSRGEMTDEEFAARFIVPMRARTRSAASRWRGDRLRPEPPEIREAEDRLEQAMALLPDTSADLGLPGPSGIPGDGS